MRSMTMLDQTGDTTIVWDEDTEKALMPIIEKKMREGVVFYLIKPRKLSFLPPKKVKAKKIEEIQKAGAVSINDEALSDLFQKGMITTGKGDQEIEVIKRAESANEVASSHSVAVRPQRGG